MKEGIPGEVVARKVYGIEMMLLHRALDLGGLGLLIAAIVAGRPEKRAAVQAL